MRYSKEEVLFCNQTDETKTYCEITYFNVSACIHVKGISVIHGIRNIVIM